MKKKELNLVYITLAGLGIYYIYNYYQKNKVKTVVQNSTPVILNESTQISPSDQVAFQPIPDAEKPVFNIKFKLPQTI
jgi:hypothetical protein